MVYAGEGGRGQKKKKRFKIGQKRNKDPKPPLPIRSLKTMRYPLCQCPIFSRNQSLYCSGRERDREKTTSCFGCSLLHRSSSSISIASGLAAGATFSSCPAGGARLPPSGPVDAATKPCGARACRSRAAMASAFCCEASPLPFVASSSRPSVSAGIWLRAIAWEAMKLTSVLKKGKKGVWLVAWGGGKKVWRF